MSDDTFVYGLVGHSDGCPLIWSSAYAFAALGGRPTGHIDHQMTDFVKRAAAKLADLEAKRARAVGRQDKLIIERRAVAYRAHDGDADARKRLDAINREHGTLAGEIAGLCDAIEVAKTRFASVQQAASMAAEREKAGEALKLAGELDAAALAADAAMAEAARAFVACVSKADLPTREAALGE